MFNYILIIICFLCVPVAIGAQWEYSEFEPNQEQINNNECLVHVNDVFAVSSNSEGAWILTDPTDEEEFQ